MCLRCFARRRCATRPTSRCLKRGARQLGAAFQDINFLRDLHDDAELGRSYLSATMAPSTPPPRRLGGEGARTTRPRAARHSRYCRETRARRCAARMRSFATH